MLGQLLTKAAHGASFSSTFFLKDLIALFFLFTLKSYEVEYWYPAYYSIAKRKSVPIFQVPKDRTRPAIRLGSGKSLDPKNEVLQ